MPKAYTPNEPVKKIYPSGAFLPPKFLPTYREWIETRGQVKSISGGRTGTTGSTILYTVPKEYTFYLTHIWMGYSSQASANTANFVMMVDNVGYLFNIKAFLDVHIADMVATSCWIPVRSGQVLKIGVECSVSVKVNGGFHGFLIRNQDIPIF